jgi:hypothetical protein
MGPGVAVGGEGAGVKQGFPYTAVKQLVGVGDGA